MSIPERILRRWSVTRRGAREWGGVVLRHPQALFWLGAWLSSNVGERSPLGDEAPWASFALARWLARQVGSESRVFEWGSGGSTLFFARRVGRLVSVEHDPGWHALVRDRLARICAPANDENTALRSEADHTYHLIEPVPLPAGEVTAVTSEQPGAAPLDFEAYVRVIEQYRDGYFDLILIDGHARLPCLHAALPKVRAGGHIVFQHSTDPGEQEPLECPLGFERRDLAGVAPYRGAVWTRSTVLRRIP